MQDFFTTARMRERRWRDVEALARIARVFGMDEQVRRLARAAVDGRDILAVEALADRLEEMGSDANAKYTRRLAEQLRQLSHQA
jgi:hypothetical protein